MGKGPLIRRVSYPLGKGFCKGEINCEVAKGHEFDSTNGRTNSAMRKEICKTHCIAWKHEDYRSRNSNYSPSK